MIPCKYCKEEIEGEDVCELCHLAEVWFAENSQVKILLTRSEACPVCGENHYDPRNVVIDGDEAYTVCEWCAKVIQSCKGD